MESTSNVFDRLRREAEAKATGKSGFFGNENILKLKQGESYKLRLLWITPPKGVNRENPMINQFIHRIWDDNAIGSKSVEVFCKTSQYDEGQTKAGWDCPICREMSAKYKEYSTSGSESAKEIYDNFRRTFRGYVPVYVIEGPEDDVNKIKILQYTKSFKDFFDEYIFGIVKTNKNDKNAKPQPTISEDDILGIDAFVYYEPKDNSIHKDGYDLSIIVGTKNVPIRGKMIKMPDYKLKFARHTSELDFKGQDMSVERYLNLSEELGYDRDLLKKSTTEELVAFLNKYIKNQTVEESVEPEEDVQVEEVVKPASKSSKLEKLQKAVTKEPEISEEDAMGGVETKNEPDVIDDLKVDDPDPVEKDDEDVDIDDLLKDI